MNASSPHNLRNRRAHPAFTLLELMVAMAMVVILAFSLYASLRTALKAKESAEAALEPSRTAAVAMEFLRNDFQNVISPGGVLAGNFIGTDSKDDRGNDGDDVNFFCTSDAADHVDGNGDLKNIELTITTEPGSSDHVLVRRVTRNLLAEVQQTPDEEIICRKVAGFNVRYFSGTDWLDSWDSTQEDNTVPVAVEVTLDLERPQAQGGTGTFRTVRVFPIACSTAASDTNVNPDGGLP